jgi:hypothetical protein
MGVVRKLALAVLLATTSAAGQAATYLMELTGAVTSQVDAGSDPNIAVGDTVKMTARFDDSRIFDNGSGKFATFYGLPTSGDQFWNVKLNGLTWQSLDEALDGLPLDFDPFDNPLQAPFVPLLAGGGLGTPTGFLSPEDTDKLPTFNLLTGEIRSGNSVDGNTYKTPGFNVSWNLGGAKLVAVPEPSVWALTIVGFGMVGAASRRRTRTLRTITA